VWSTAVSRSAMMLLSANPRKVRRFEPIKMFS